jgi:hypothetical protein
MRQRHFRRRFLAICGCLCALVSHAQQPEDHLVPATGYYTDRWASYHARLQDVLCAGLSNKPLARVIAQPALRLEYVVSVDQKEGKYYLTYRLPQTSIWGAIQKKSDEKIEVKTQTLELTEATATALAQLFSVAIAQTKYPKPMARAITDGETYTFVTFERWAGFRAGEIWSPPTGTRMGRLVAVVESLRKATAQPQPLPAALLQEIAQLAAALRAE